jgi:hypothetical protein
MGFSILPNTFIGAASIKPDFMIRIEKNKILYTDTSNETQEIYSADIPAHLGDVVELGEFVAFSRVFDLIVDNRALFNSIFAKDLGHYAIEQFLEEYNKPVSRIDTSFDLEVHIVCQAHNYPEYRDFEYYVAFHGLGILEDDLESEEPYPISLSFTSLNELKTKYIRVNNQVQVYTYSGEGNIDRSPVYEGEIKLFDFFAAILNEISFFGDPDSRDKVSDEVLRSAEAVDSGEEELIPMEEIQAQWDRELEEAKQKEEQLRLENVKEKIASGYIRDFIEATFQETIEKLELLEKDLVSLERYEDAKLVQAKIEKLNGEN